MNEERDRLRGRFRYCLFASADFGIYKFETATDTLTVTGPLIQVDMRTDYVLDGFYTHHPKYGFQFRVEHYQPCLPDEKEEILHLLSSSLFAGIGKKTAEKIIDFYGEDCLEILKNNPDAVDDLPISPKQRKAVSDGFARLNDPISEQRIRFLQAGFSNGDCNVVVNTYQENLFAVLEENPYRLFHEVEGIGFHKIDKYCLSIGIVHDDERRKVALLCYLMQDASFRRGDSYLLQGELLQEYYVKSAYDDGEYILDKAVAQSLLHTEEERVYLYKDYLSEELIASFLLKLHTDSLPIDEVYLNDFIGVLEEREGIVYAPEQQKAIRAFFNHRFSLICGGPGTGKTTVVKALVSISKMINPYQAIAIAAPTGRAAKRISELCDVSSHTIHSLLGWDKESNTFRYNEHNPMLLDTLIIDEFSMVDTQLFASLLKGCGVVKRICIIGDNQQLPSIRPGDVLRDLLASDVFAVSNLKVNFRQKEGNEIIRLAEEIKSGEIHFENYGKDVHFIEDSSVKSEFLHECLGRIFAGKNIDEWQVLSPMYAGGYGIDSLNLHLQDTHNPDCGQQNFKQGTKVYRVGDKILQLKNQANDDIYNGDIGKLSEIDGKEKTLIVDFDGRYVPIPYENIDNIRLAYAISVHKSQGSEYPGVVLCVSRHHQVMLDQKLLYTAVTRAKRSLFIIGDIDVFQRCLKHRRAERKTTLQERILRFMDDNRLA